MDVCCECCVLTGGGLCDELITRPEESCRLVRRERSRNLVNDEALAHWGAVGPETNSHSGAVRSHVPASLTAHCTMRC